MLVTRKSLLTDLVRTMDIPCTQEQFDNWQSGILIQQAMPNLSAWDREFLISGATKEEWELFEEKEKQINKEPKVETLHFKPEFEKCLKGIKKAFMKELKIDIAREKKKTSRCGRGATIEERYEKLNNCETFYSFIDRSFIWRLTEQGEEFWHDIANTRCIPKQEPKKIKKG